MNAAYRRSGCRKESSLFNPPASKRSTFGLEEERAIRLATTEPAVPPKHHQDVLCILLKVLLLTSHNNEVKNIRHAGLVKNLTGEVRSLQKFFFYVEY
jgi:hypothetical protein